MSLRDIGRDAVVQATAEYDRLGQDEFLRTYGYGRAREYELLLDGRTYDSKAVLGVAHKYAVGVPLTWHQLSGGEQTVSRLVDLGFEILRGDTRSPGIGEVAGVPTGRVFPSRSALAAAGVHRALQAGIVGTAPRGAESIVVSGGYEDDEDYGQVIVYTGHGGRDRAGWQVADQTFDSTGNAALVTSCLTGSPVRVCRGPVADSPHAPAEGYRYDGLYAVESYWREPGQRGYLVCRFRLLQVEPAGLGGAVDVRSAAQPPPAGGQAPGRQPITIQRIIRSTAVADYVKRLHDHTCQVCGTRLNLGDRGYSEGAHIRPLGRPHDGPDVPTNMLCLCANCHVLFDNGAITIQEQQVLLNGQPHGSLRTHPHHLIDDTQTVYHRSIHR